MKVTREQLIEMIKNNEDVSNVDMSDLFFDNKTFNQDISKWNVSNMECMFHISNFNKNIINLKKLIIKENNPYSKKMNFIKNNIVIYKEYD